MLSAVITILQTELAKARKIQEASSKDLTELFYKGKRCLLFAGREQDPDLSAVNILIFPAISLQTLYKTVPATQHTSGFVSSEAEWFGELLQVA